MVRGWRLPFCTTFHKDTTTTTKPIPNDEIDNTNTHPTSRFSFFSSTTSSATSTPRTNHLRCRTASATAPVSLSNSPKLTCKTSSTSSSTKNSPRLTTRIFHRSCPSSPTSPSSFSLLKSTLRLSKPRCGVCLHSVKTGQGTAIFTAECSHQFHFPCVVDLVRKRTPLALLCPVCTATWKELPLLDSQKSEVDEFGTKSDSEEGLKPVKTAKPSDLKIYNDDEPLMSPTAGRRFNPIPESDYENEDDESLVDEDSFQGFFTSAADSSSSFSPVSDRNGIDVTLLPYSTFISAGHGYETVAVLMEVKAPDVQTRANGKTSSFRAPVDLVAVIDVSNKSNLQTTKRAMRVLISSLSSNDRLSIVAFSSCSKRLLPLRRMTIDGRRAARRMVDVIVATEQSMSMSASDAVRKAAKVLEDRRVKNSVNTIIVLSNGSESPPTKTSTNNNRRILSVKTTRLSHLNIPIHTFAISDLSSACDQNEAFAKSIGRLLFVPVQDLRVQFGSIENATDVRAVYLCSGRTKWLGSGTGLIKLGDFHADEKREILIELRVPVTSSRAHLAISVRSSYTDPSSQQLVTCRDKALSIPIPDPKRSSPSRCQGIERLRCLFITARAVAESKRLAERNDFSGANQFLTSALSLVSQSKSASVGEYVSVVEAELVELKWRRQQAKLQWEKAIGRRSEEVVLTPTSAWRTAERLAKVARMRKSLNRVSDLHGFENARF